MGYRFLVLETYRLGEASLARGDFKNRGFALKKHEMFSVHTTPDGRNFKTQQLPIILDLCWLGKSQDYCDAIIFK